MTNQAAAYSAKTKKKKSDLSTLRKKGYGQALHKRLQEFATFISELKENRAHTYSRLVLSPADREVDIWDPYREESRKMLMFASNNYLGLANHPYVREQVQMAIEKYGVGVGGPPLLNGFTRLMKELEERLAAFKGQEAAMVFPTGFQSNLGLIGGLVKKGDHIVYDHLSHASFYDAMRLTKGKSSGFRHNDMEDLEYKLQNLPPDTINTFIGVEGVYSMDGDLAPLDQVAAISRKYGAWLLVDDAHGTGVLGEHGSGTAEYFGIKDQVDVSMGTFSKVFAVTGGFLTGSAEMINYLRYFARSYMFSASLPPMSLAAVLAGLDVIEREPERRTQLHDICNYARKRLENFDFYAKPDAAIIALSVPQHMDIRRIAYQVHECGIFLNAIEYPAVPLDQQRFRISLMSEHTKEDVDKLASCLEEAFEAEQQSIDY
jgi:glycine C-acetyltransferase